MTVFVKETSNSILSGLSKMKSAMIEDYKNFTYPDTDIRKRMNENYKNGFEIRYGKKYIKIITNDSVSAFIVGTDNDKKFMKGDILKPAGWAAPARNAARGNILNGMYCIEWTGACYLK